MERDKIKVGSRVWAPETVGSLHHAATVVKIRRAAAEGYTDYRVRYDGKPGMAWVNAERCRLMDEPPVTVWGH